MRVSQVVGILLRFDYCEVRRLKTKPGPPRLTATLVKAATFDQRHAEF